MSDALQKFLHLVLSLGIMMAPSLTHAQSQLLSEQRVRTDKGWELRIHNNAEVSLDAFQIAFRCPGLQDPTVPSYEMHEDTLVSFGNHSTLGIPAGGDRSIPLHNQLYTCQGGVVGGIFEDGTTVDSPIGFAGLTFLYGMRQGEYAGLTLAKRIFDQVAAGEVTPEQAALDLDIEKQKLPKGQIADISKSLGESSALSFAALLFRKQVGFITPSDSTPERQPKIEDLMEKRHIPREKAHAQIVGEKFRQWMNALKDNLGEPATPSK